MVACPSSSDCIAVGGGGIEENTGSSPEPFMSKTLSMWVVCSIGIPRPVPPTFSVAIP